MEKNQTLNITIQFGIPKNQQLIIANIFYENFQDKFKIFLGNKKKAIPLIASTLEDDRIIVAIKNGKVIGFAGLQYHKKSFSIPSLTQIVKIYGFMTIRTFPFFVISSFNKPKSFQLHLESLAVTGKEQGKGIGTQLLNATINHAKAKSFSQIKLEVIQTNQKAKKLYKKIGFKSTKIIKIPYPFSYIIGFSSFEEMLFNLKT